MHQFALPGYPSSHSCIRMRENDAKFFYYWADQWMPGSHAAVAAFGTPLVVFGKYPFGKEKPWLTLAADRHALMIAADSIKKAVNEFLPMILERQQMKDSVLSRQENVMPGKNHLMKISLKTDNSHILFTDQLNFTASCKVNT